MLFTALGYAQVGINTNNPDASSALEIESTTGGILIPRLTETQRDAITEPATGLMIYQTNQTTGFYFFDGTVWTKIDGVAGPQGLAGSDGAQGPVGPAGAQGIQGETGPKGDQGPAGAQGPVGPEGAQGIQGATGAAGPVGDQGLQGDTGIQGVQGDVGPLVSGTNGQTLYNNGTEWVATSNLLNSGASVGIGLTATIDASAVLQIESNTQGVLFPRMTVAQRNAIPSPAQGLIIFCSDCAFGEGELQVKLTSSWKKIMGGDVNDSPVVGSFYGGGVVFYIFVAGDTGYVAGETHGLIAAVQDQSSGIQWHNGSYVTTGATNTAVGTGATNTTTIISVQGAAETSYAAGLARAYNGGEFNDWFLPSKDELNKMFQNKSTINTTAALNSGSNFSTNYYWSSTEYGNIYAWIQDFSYGGQGEFDKGRSSLVRAVRAF